jgi:hypothetical protein
MESITDDLFDIVGRLKNIDPQYQIYRNHERERYELWWNGRFSLEIPFDRLDERTLEYAQKTRRENADEIESAINLRNAEIELEKQKNLEIMQAKIKDYVLYEHQKYY